MKILHVIGGLDRGGAESYLMNTLRDIDLKKYHCDVLVFLAPRDGKKYVYADELEKLGVKIIKIQDNRFRKPWQFVRDVEQVLRDGQYDAIHSHIDFMSALTLTAARKAGVTKRIAHSHNTSNDKFNRPIMRTIAKILRRRLNREVTQRVACGEDAGRFLYGENQPFTIVHNGIDLDKYRFDEKVRAKKRDEYKLSDDSMALLNIGRLVPQKNQRRLLEIFADYLRTNSDAKLFIIGEGPLEEDLREYAKTLEIEDKFVLLSARDDVNDYYQMADVFLLPSLFEGVPTVGIEAQASGLRCLFSAHVPAETKLLPTTDFLPLSDDWTPAILSSRNREAALEANKVKAYDIRETSKKIVEIYDKA